MTTKHEVTMAEALAMRAAHEDNPPTLTPWAVRDNSDPDTCHITAPEAAVTLGLFYEPQSGGAVDARYAVDAVNAHLRLVDTVIALRTDLDALRAPPAPVDRSETSDSWETSVYPHTGCGGTVTYREINDYPDIENKCSKCCKVWRVDGPDA